MRPHFLVASVILVLILAGITVLWISHTHAAPRVESEADSLARDLVIRGRYAMDRQTEGSLREAVACFQQATARAPRFAGAYAGLADAYNLLAQYGYMAPREGMEQARHAARQSLDLDPQLAEGHVALAAMLEAYDWNWAAAEREYRRALELNPALKAGRTCGTACSCATRAGCGRLCRNCGGGRAGALLGDGQRQSGLRYAGRGRFRRSGAGPARSWIRRPTCQRADGPRARLARGGADDGFGRGPVAGDRPANGNPHALSLLACTCARLGRREESVRAVKQVEWSPASATFRHSTWAMFRWCWEMETGPWIWFEEAYRQRSSGLISLRKTRRLASSDTPRFLSLLGKMHFTG